MCQTVWTQIKPDMLSGLIWLQTVCKGYVHSVVIDLRAKSPFYVNYLCVSILFSLRKVKRNVLSRWILGFNDEIEKKVILIEYQWF